MEAYLKNNKNEASVFLSNVAHSDAKKHLLLHYYFPHIELWCFAVNL